MPISKHFGGHGKEVMKNMKSEYGAKKGKQVFYATENKRKQDSGFYGHHLPAEMMGHVRQIKGGIHGKGETI